MSDVITLPKSFSRTSPRPVDRESLFASYADLLTYATSPIAYPGQIVSVSATNLAYIINGDYSVQPLASQGFSDSKFLPLSGGFVTGDIICNSSISAALLNVDNIRIDGNIISSTNINGNIALQPNGNGITTVGSNLSASGTVTGNIINAVTGYKVNNAATTGHVLRGNGTDFVSSTLAASDIASGQALTKTDDTNVTLTLGGTPSTALLKSTSLTLGWTGQLAAGRGGTGSAFTQFTGPASTVKTFTLPNASATILTTNDTVTILQGGTGATTQQGAINALAGAVTSGQYLRGNGTNVVMSSIQAGDVPTLNQNTTGSAATLTTTRTLWGQPFNGSQNVSGTLSAVGNIIGTSAITISAAHNQDITLQTTGTGEVNIPKVDIDGGTIDGTTIGLTVPASAVFTGVTVAGNVNIDGNLFVTGSATQINTTDLVVRDPIIFLAEGNLTDSVDIGFTAAYDHGEPIPRHTGLIRDDITKEWTLFSNLSVEILSAIQIPLDDSSVKIDTLNANIKGTLTGNVSGTAAQAVKLTTGRTISTTGDVLYTSGAFDGSANVTGTATISSNVVSYSKIQKVNANKILGNPTGSLADVSEIDCTEAGRELLNDATAADQRNTLGVGAAQSVTFADVTVNNANNKSALSKVYNGTVTGGNTLTLTTFPSANYFSAKYTVQIKDTISSERCALEIIATNNNGSWEGTVYGIVDPGDIFSNVDVGLTNNSVYLEFTLKGNSNYNIIAYTQALSD
jgi:hypothetical protein